MDRITYHTVVSWFKSMARILGYIWLLLSLKVGIALLLIAEVLGIIEEL